MTAPTPSGRAALRLPVVVIALVALVLAFGGGATAAKLIDGKLIKKNTVTSKQIKNGTLTLADLKASEVAKLRGKDGVDGAPGASAFVTPPSGTVLKGGGALSGYPGAFATNRVFDPLPFSTATRLVDTGPGRNVFFAPTTLAPSDQESASRCAGTANAPTATPGTLCLYVVQGANIDPNSALVFAGVGAVVDEAEFNGFTVTAIAAGVGEAVLRYVWVYTAP